MIRRRPAAAAFALAVGLGPAAAFGQGEAEPPAPAQETAPPDARHEAKPETPSSKSAPTPNAPATGETASDVARPGAREGMPSRPSNLEPFGPGTGVQVTSSDIVDVYVAKGSAEISGEIPLTEFVKVGKTPVTFQLPPGLYTLEVESPDVTRGQTVLQLDHRRREIVARTGSTDLATIGSITLALGITAILTGAVTLAAFNEKPDLDSREGKIAIPLLAGGAVFTGVGIGMLVASRTDLEEMPVEDAPKKATTRGLVATASLSF